MPGSLPGSPPSSDDEDLEFGVTDKGVLDDTASGQMDVPTLSITLLGAGQEVGRSCCVLQYRDITIVLDAGVHPAHTGMASLPFIDELDWSTVDAILVTHFHLDHAAALTYITEKTNFREGKGKVYMTHPTKALHKFMMQDFVRMSNSSTDALISPLDLSILITPCPGVTFTPYHAGHVLGASGLKVLYTGDYSREEDRHLVKAEVPPIRPDVLIVESTYGVQSLEGREEKELRFTNLVHSIIRRGGHVLLPTFALGRAQELLLILDEYWKKHPDLHNVPIYYASSLARKCMAVYQTYIHTMNSNIRTRFARRDNPFVFKYIAEGPPCVVLASPGMLQPGTSRELFELWAPDPRNGLIVTGYSDIMNEPEEVTGVKGNTIPRKLSVDYISFSAHVDYSQNSEFIDMIKAPHIVLVHGEQTAMGRLRAALQAKYKNRDEDIKVHSPRNLETLNLTFRPERVAKVIGGLASKPPQTNDVLSGLLVSKDYSYTLLDPRDLRDFAGLSTCVVTQRQKVALGVGWELVRWHLEVDLLYSDQVMNAVDVKQTAPHELILEWDSSAANDMIADSTLAVITEIDKSPASAKVTSGQSHRHEHEHHPHSDHDYTHNPMVRIQRLGMFLEAHFGDVEYHIPDEDMDTEQEEPTARGEPSFLIQLDDAEARINLLSMTVDSSSDALRRRVEAVLEMAASTVSSLSESFASGAPEESSNQEAKSAASPSDEKGEQGENVPR
ncbi:beta-lactamase-like protein [Lactarius indigo]|nr:beta-lactamase-like protein [Lactarius indigo]